VSCIDLDERSGVARYAFYLANTSRDCGRREAALRVYLRRASLGGWQQEVFMSLLNAAGLRDELAVCAYWTSRYLECRDACDRLLREGKLPAEHRARVLHNRDLAAAKLGPATTAERSLPTTAGTSR
jgi:hypothetical protein